MNDPQLRLSLEQFFSDSAARHKDMLLRAVRLTVRDIMREARIAGQVEAYETVFEELQRYAVEQLRAASQ